jgi:hypothetical protein
VGGQGQAARLSHPDSMGTTQVGACLACLPCLPALPAKVLPSPSTMPNHLPVKLPGGEMEQRQGCGLPSASSDPLLVVCSVCVCVSLGAHIGAPSTSKPGPALPSSPKGNKRKAGCWLDAWASKSREASKGRRTAAGKAAGMAAAAAAAAARSAGSGEAAAAGAGGTGHEEEAGVWGAVLACKQHAVLYHFNEGYTNAVKRPLLLSDLL